VGNPRYPVELSSSQRPGFPTDIPVCLPGRPLGGYRFAFYVGDTWKILPKLSLNLGVRYVRDTGRTDSDLPALPQLDALIPGTGGRIRQPNRNFAPQIGIAWDPAGHGKTVIRAGAGLFYENFLYNPVSANLPPRLASGAFLQTPLAWLRPEFADLRPWWDHRHRGRSLR
jgi:outer membrane receptor protein involved in Fe transport